MFLIELTIAAIGAYLFFDLFKKIRFVLSILYGPFDGPFDKKWVISNPKNMHFFKHKKVF